METDQITQLYRIRKTLLQMFLDRGFTVSQKAMDMTFDEFRYPGRDKQDIGNVPQVSRQSVTLLSSKKQDPEERIMAFFSTSDKKLGSNDIIGYAQKMYNQQVKNGIIVSKMGITRIGQQTIQQLQAINKIQVFEDAELLINITQHQLVPKHFIIKEIEKVKLLERYRIKQHQLPKIMITDPVARYLGMKRGDVVKIIRNSQTAGKYVTYRVGV